MDAAGTRREYLKALYMLAIPVMLEQLGQILLGTVDTYFAGRIGDNAIAAINVTNMFMNLFITIFNSLGLGIVVMISHALGARDGVKANRILRQAVQMGTMIGLGIGLINLFCGKVFLQLAGAEGEILEMGITYYLAVCVPCVFLSLVMILASGLKAAQNTRASMRAALAANIVNAVLDALFVHMGWGVLGLGVATTLARALNLCLLLRLYIRPVTSLKLDHTGWSRDLPLMKELIGYSGPIMLTQLAARFAILVHGSLTLRLGSIFYTANSITTQIDEYACVPSAGFEAATATMVSNSLGAEKPRDAVRYAKLAFFSTTFWMTALGIVLAAFAIPLAALFTQTTEIQEMVRQVLTLMVFFNWTSALSHIMTSAVQGTGDSRYPFYVTLAGNVLMRLGMGYVLAYVLHWNLIGIWCGIILDFLLRGNLLVARLVKKFRVKD